MGTPTGGRNQPHNESSRRALRRRPAQSQRDAHKRGNQLTPSSQGFREWRVLKIVHALTLHLFAEVRGEVRTALPSGARLRSGGFGLAVPVTA